MIEYRICFIDIGYCFGWTDFEGFNFKSNANIIMGDILHVDIELVDDPVSLYITGETRVIERCVSTDMEFPTELTISPKSLRFSLWKKEEKNLNNLSLAENFELDYEDLLNNLSLADMFALKKESQAK